MQRLPVKDVGPTGIEHPGVENEPHWFTLFRVISVQISLQRNFGGKKISAAKKETEGVYYVYAFILVKLVKTFLLFWEKHFSVCPALA